MSEKVLLVDDDEFLLSSYQRTLRRNLSFDTACGGVEALEKIKAGECYAAILTDLRMPSMSGLELLRQVHQVSPDTVGMILTGNADLKTAIDAVNEGNVFRFLEKPFSGDDLTKVLTAAINQYRLVVAERDVLEQTLHGTIDTLTQVLELINPEASSTASRVATYVRHLVSHFGLKDPWQFHVAAMLSQLGSSVLSHGARSPKRHEIAYDLLRKIPRLEIPAKMIRRQDEAFKNQTYVPLAERDAELVGAQILKVATRFEALVRGGMSFVQAVDTMLAQPEEYDSSIAIVFRELPRAELPYEPRTVKTNELMLRMILDEEVRTSNGALVVRKGVEVTEVLLARLGSFHERRAIADTIRVLVPDSVR